MKGVGMTDNQIRACAGIPCANCGCVGKAHRWDIFLGLQECHEHYKDGTCYEYETPSEADALLELLKGGK